MISFIDMTKLPVVSSKEIFKSTNGEEEVYHPEGLYSEQIFGCKKPFKCQCGELDGRYAHNETCSECGCVVDDGTKRSKTYAKIKLGSKVINPIFKKSLEQLFGLKQINDLISREMSNYNQEDPYIFEINSSKLQRFSALKESKKQNNLIVKIPIYDIPSLAVLFEALYNDQTLNQLIFMYMDKSFCQNQIFIDEVLVIPPTSRRINKIGNKLNIPDISKYYEKILKLNHSTILELSSLDRIDDIDDKELLNKASYDTQAVLFEMYNFGIQYIKKLIKESFSGSTVEYSQRSTIIPDPSLSPYGVGMDFESVHKMFIGEFLHYIYQKVQEGNSIMDIGVPQLAEFIELVQSGVKLTDKIPEDLFKDFLNKHLDELVVIIERAPVLWKYNFSRVRIEKVEFPDDNTKFFKKADPTLDYDYEKYQKVLRTNTTYAQAFNLDYDGDSLSAYAIQSKQAKEESWDASLGNTKNVRFEHNDSLIHDPEHESIYACWALTDAAVYTNERINNGEEYEQLVYETLDDFKFTWKTLNNCGPTHRNNPDKFNKDNILVQINKIETLDGKIVSINLPIQIMAINKAIGYLGIGVVERYPKKKTRKLVKLILDTRENQFYDIFHSFNKFLLWTSTAVGYANPSFDLEDFKITSQTITDYKSTLINEPFIGFHQNWVLFTEVVRKEIEKNPTNSLYRVFESDARIKSVQLLKAGSNGGFPTDIYGKAFENNIKNSLLDGLTPDEFYLSGNSARLALAQRQEAIPQGGELQRKFYWSTGFLKANKTKDCGSQRYLKLLVKNKSHLNILKERWYKDGNELVLIKGDEEELIGQHIMIRSPIYCESSSFGICKTCLGNKTPTSAALGAAIGSYIPESIIQSVLRTHHFSGAFITDIQDEIIELINRNRFESPNKFFTSSVDDVKKIQEYYKEMYPEENHIKLDLINTTETGEMEFEIKINELPFNDDAVKILNGIVGIIDKERSTKKGNFMPIEEMYELLHKEIGDGIISLYFELLISLLYYDENNVILRYSDNEPVNQISITKVIYMLDPKLILFYTFSYNAITHILRDKDKELGGIHMYNQLLSKY